VRGGDACRPEFVIGLCLNRSDKLLDKISIIIEWLTFNSIISVWYRITENTKWLTSLQKMKSDALETDPSNHTPRCYPSKVIGILEYSFDIYI
jgi:hypothetical protein